MMTHKSRVGWGRIVLHVILPAGLTVLLFVGIIFGIMLPKFHQCVLRGKHAQSRDLVVNVCNLLEQYYQRTVSGELSVEESQQRALERIRVMRYGGENNNYFWVHTLEPVMVMHPYRTDLEGQDITDLQDAQGKPLFIEMNQVVQTSPTHDGYIDYYWQWADEARDEVPKTSYVQLFEPWGWVVGTGIYLKDVQAEVQSVTDAFQLNLVIICMVVTAFCGYLIYRGIRGEMQRQESQRQLHESLERFKTVMDGLNAVVYVSDMQTYEILFLNRRARVFLGLGQRDEVAGMRGQACWALLQHDRSGPCEFCTNDKLHDENGLPTGVYRWEFQNTRNRRWYECHDQAIRWVDGRWARLEIATDITDRKNAEQEREQLLKSLALKNDELQSIVFIASHDLRSPLINIHGFTAELEVSIGRLGEILKKDPQLCERPDIQTVLNDEVPESLDFIKAGTNKMQMLVDGLLQLSRLGIAQPQIETLNMQALIQAVLSACQFQINSLHAKVVFDGLPDCRADAKLVNQVFTNLIDNALKYSHPERPPRIEITGRVIDGQVEYAVSDIGEGIEKGHLTKIFDMFCQCNSRKSVSDGVGLGLTIVKRILDILDGQIRVESEFDKGSVFYVTLPAAGK